MPSKLLRNKLGSDAEAFACQYLSEQGLKILAQNYRIRQGEIDIIAQEHEMLVFIEVRMRKHHSFGGAAQSIDARKQQRLIKTAQHYLMKTGLTDAQPCRFDAICLSPAPSSQQDSFTTDWIRDAFRP